MSEVRLTTVYDNYEHNPKLRVGWGFSCWTEVGDRTILFDTGADRLIEMFNIEQLGLDLQEVDLIVLSHAHNDHIGGLTGVLEGVNHPTVAFGRSVPRDLKEKLHKYHVNTVEVERSTELVDRVHSTGELGKRIREQSLAIDTDRGWVVVTGCAHPGVVQVAQAVSETHQGSIHLLLGGFHLHGKSDDEIRAIIAQLRDLDVEKAAPCHCSGDRARELFEQAYGDDFIANGVGKVIEV